MRIPDEKIDEIRAASDAVELIGGFVALKKSGMTPLSAYAMMAFVLIYIPCLATVSVIRRETNSWKWTAFSIAYSTILAWGVAFLIYQGGKGIGLA